FYFTFIHRRFFKTDSAYAAHKKRPAPRPAHHPQGMHNIELNEIYEQTFPGGAEATGKTFRRASAGHRQAGRADIGIPSVSRRRCK
ncbi:hypothetical protein, partial [Selenomonas bovis]|uniref:hypothetical protein n=1 Tax=Selenomonas bovis TaxID=416586 RepID=UPI003AB92051